jgi:transposase
VTPNAAVAARFADIRPAHSANAKLRQLGEDVTEELEYKPGRFVVNRIVRLRMACTCCEKIS